MHLYVCPNLKSQISGRTEHRVNSSYLWVSETTSITDIYVLLLVCIFCFFTSLTSTYCVYYKTK